MAKDKEKSGEEIALLQNRIVELEAREIESKKIEQIAKDAQELAEAIVETVQNSLLVLDGGLNVVSTNKSFYTTFAVRPEETIGKLIYDLGNRQWDIPKLRNLLDDIIPYNTSFNNYVIEHEFQTIGKRIMVLNARRIPRPPEKLRMILLAIEDITDMDKVKMTFEKMASFGLFSKVAKEKEAAIVELREEVDDLLVRLGEKLKYGNGKK